MENGIIGYFEKPFSPFKIKFEHIRFGKKNQANCERYIPRAIYNGSDIEISNLILI